MIKILNEDIDITTLARHFEEAHSSPRSAYESFRQLRRKWDESKTGLWIVYVKAYNYDTMKLGTCSECKHLKNGYCVPNQRTIHKNPITASQRVWIKTATCDKFESKEESR